MAQSIVVLLLNEFNIITADGELFMEFILTHNSMFSIKETFIVKFTLGENDQNMFNSPRVREDMHVTKECIK